VRVRKRQERQRGTVQRAPEQRSCGADARGQQDRQRGPREAGAWSAPEKRTCSKLQLPGLLIARKDRRAIQRFARLCSYPSSVCYMCRSVVCERSAVALEGLQSSLEGNAGRRKLTLASASGTAQLTTRGWRIERERHSTRLIWYVTLISTKYVPDKHISHCVLSQLSIGQVNSVPPNIFRSYFELHHAQPWWINSAQRSRRPRAKQA